MHGFVVCLINQARKCRFVSIIYGPNWGVAKTLIINLVNTELGGSFCYFPSIIFVDIFLQIYFDVRVVNHFAEIQRYLSQGNLIANYIAKYKANSHSWS